MNHRHLVLGVFLAAHFACGGNVEKDGSGGHGTGAGSGAGSAVSASGSTGSGGGSSSAATGSGGAGGACPDDCQGFACCAGACVNTQNDIENCGTCGNTCPGAHPYCDHGKCGAAPCGPLTDCAPDAQCCAESCCDAGQLCCTVPGPVGETTSCVAPTEAGTCPLGCLECKCASPDTPIATPDGDRAIASIRPGELVYSIDGAALRAVPVLDSQVVRAERHVVVRVTLSSGAVLELSPAHPTADGRTFGALRAGDRLDRELVTDVRVVGYRFDHTYDILPASDTGTYVAGGVLVGSTMHGRVSR